MPNKYTVSVDITGKDTLTSKLQGVHKSLNNFGANIRSALRPSLAGFEVDLVGIGKELFNLGLESEKAEFKLRGFAGSQERAAEMAEAFAKGADHEVTSLQAMAGAAELLKTGVVGTADEMRIAGGMVTDLAKDTMDATSAAQALAQSLNTGSARGLTAFGISVEKVDKRTKELAKTGLSLKEAFRAAVFEEAKVALDKLGDDSGLLSTKLDKLKIAAMDAKIGFGELITDWVNLNEKTLTLGLGLDEVAARLRVLPETFQKAVAILIYGFTYWDQFVEHLGNVKVAAFEAKGAVARYLDVHEDLVPKVEELTEATGKSATITMDEVKARLASNSAAQAALGPTGKLLKITEDLAVATGELSEQLKSATQAQIASVAIKGLTAAYEAGKVPLELYTEMSNQLRITTGLATPESIALATALQLNNDALVKGTINTDQWRQATDLLVASGKAAADTLDTLKTKLEEANVPAPTWTGVEWETDPVTGKRKAKSRKRAAGGPIFDPGAYLVGERGPELVGLPRGSFVLDAGDTRRLMANIPATGLPTAAPRGGDMTVVNNFNQTVNTRATVSTVAMDFQAMRALAR